MLAADNWCVKVHDRVYGPYSSEQLRKFVHEGRLAGWSMIAPAGSRDWREARRETTFANYFGDKKDALPANATNGFGRRREGEPPARQPAARAAFSERTARPVGVSRRAQPIGQFGSDQRASEPTGPANFIIIFDVVSGAAGRVETAMRALGPAFRIADNVWTAHCSLTTIGVRNALTPYLRGAESIFVVDATHGRTSWQNYPPEAHAKLTAAFINTKGKAQ